MQLNYAISGEMLYLQEYKPCFYKGITLIKIAYRGFTLPFKSFMFEGFFACSADPEQPILLE